MEICSLIWTTDLQSGEVVAGATVALYDCMGKVLATGTSDSKGMLWIDRRLDNETSPSICYPSNSDDDYLASEEKFKPRYIAAAWTDTDFSFVLSSCDQGIEAWRFGIYPSNVEYGETAYHTILSRNLLKRGETVRMKHVARQRTMSGFELFSKEKLPPKMALRHQGSDESYTAALTWTENGTADAEVALPAHAKLGEYSIVLVSSSGDDTYTGTLSVEDYRLPALRGYIKSVSATNLCRKLKWGFPTWPAAPQLVSQ